MDANCSRCGKPISGSDVYYSMQGAPLCPACNAGNELLEADKRVGAKIQGAGGTALGLAFLSFAFNPFFLVTIGAISSAVYVLRSFAPGDERFTQHVNNHGSVKALAIAAIVIAGLRFVLLFALAGR